MYTTEIYHQLAEMNLFYGPKVSYSVQNPTEDVGQDEGTLGKSITPTEHVDSDRDTVGEVQPDNRSRNNRVESTGRSQEDQSEDDNQRQVEVQRVQGDLQLGVDLREVGRERQTAVSGKSVTHAATSGHDSGSSKQHAYQREARVWSELNERRMWVAS
jgi:hypothetical protein